MLRKKTIIPGDGPLIAIGYKYKIRKILSFIATDNEGRTNSGIPYLSNYPDQFSNVAIRLVDCLLVMSNLLEYVNEVESHNKPRQSYLLLEKFWVTQCG